MRPQLIIFDIDGTLAKNNDTVIYQEAVLAHFPMASMNTGWASYRYSTVAGILSEIVMQTMNRPVTEVEISLVEASYLSRYKKRVFDDPLSCQPIPDAKLIFERLAALHIDVAIATGNWPSAASFTLSAVDIPYKAIPLAHGNDHHDRVKIIEIAIERAKLFYQCQAYDKITYVGDGVWDKKAAQVLKINFVGIGDHFNFPACQCVSNFEGPEFINTIL